jgi:3-oxoacyl-[acyl-carrier protein] reductase
VAAQAAVRHMSAGGRIINIGSNVAERAVFPGFSLYAMSKTALIGLTKALGRELGGSSLTARSGPSPAPEPSHRNHPTPRTASQNGPAQKRAGPFQEMRLTPRW